MKKALPYILLAVLALAVFLVKRYKKSHSPRPKPRNDYQSSVTQNRDRGFDRRVSYLQYSNHAKCRMQCRQITQQEVEEVMRDGKINYNKSDVQNARCPRYALETVTNDKQHVRVVFAQCNEFTEVVTVIDLDSEWTCDCPGDDDKYKNKN